MKNYTDKYILKYIGIFLVKYTQNSSFLKTVDIFLVKYTQRETVLLNFGAL